MESNNDAPIAEPNYEALFDAIEGNLSIAVEALSVASILYRRMDTSTVYPDEAVATYQCENYLREVMKSVQDRREKPNDYELSPVVEELIDRLQEDK